MTPPVCGLILAAGEGQRLRPLTEQLPKALCPVGNVPLLDRVLARMHGLGLTDVAVNAAYLAGQIVRHVGDRPQRDVFGRHMLGSGMSGRPVRPPPAWARGVTWRARPGRLSAPRPGGVRGRGGRRSRGKPWLPGWG